MLNKNTGVLLSFDLRQEDLKKYYSLNSPQNAYRDLRNYLEKNGFQSTKDSDYRCLTINIDKASDIVIDFSRNNKWFPLSLKKITISPYEDKLDITKFVKDIYSDIEYKINKDKEYEKTLDFKIQNLKNKTKNNQDILKEQKKDTVKKDIVHNLNNKKNNRQKER